VKFIYKTGANGTELIVEVVPYAATIGTLQKSEKESTRAVVAFSYKVEDEAFLRELLENTTKCDYSIYFADDDVICLMTCLVGDISKIAHLVPEAYRDILSEIQGISVASIAGSSEVGKRMFSEPFATSGEFDLIFARAADVDVNEGTISGPLRNMATLTEIGDTFPELF